MVKKFLKIWMVYVLGSCFIYVASDNALVLAKRDHAVRHGRYGDAVKMDYGPIIMKAIDNYKEAFRLNMD